MYLFFSALSAVLNYLSYNVNLQGIYSDRHSQRQMSGKHFIEPRKALYSYFLFDVCSIHLFSKYLLIH